jgi:hypothetical protein
MFFFIAILQLLSALSSKGSAVEDAAAASVEICSMVAEAASAVENTAAVSVDC